MAAANTKTLTAEFVGTFLLVFTIGCNVLGKTPVWAGVSIACVLMVSIYALGGVSGANFNPAVSLAIAGSTARKGPGDMSFKVCGMYCATQILAGVLAAWCYCLLFWNSFRLGPSKGFGVVSTGLCETLYTFMLCFVVLNVAIAKKVTEGKGNQWYGLAIGFVIVAGAYGAGVVSGGCFNPAVAIGIDLSSLGGWSIVYTLFEIIGAVLAVIAFQVVRPDEFGMGHPGLASKLVCEFLGTYMLVLTVGLNVLGNSPAGAFSIAAALMCMIYAVGDISGAHFNPAVTVAIFVSRLVPELDPKTVGCYIAVQLLGGALAAFTYTFIYFGNTFPLGPLPGANWVHVFIAEFLFTFLLCYVVLCTAVSKETKSEQMYGLAIGSCVTVGGFAIGSISGGSLNPAVSFGIAASQILNGGFFYKALIYSAFELVGAVAAAGLLKVTHTESPDNLKSLA